MVYTLLSLLVFVKHLDESVTLKIKMELYLLKLLSNGTVFINHVKHFLSFVTVILNQCSNNLYRCLFFAVLDLLTFVLFLLTFEGGSSVACLLCVVSYVTLMLFLFSSSLFLSEPREGCAFFFFVIWSCIRIQSEVLSKTWASFSQAVRSRLLVNYMLSKVSVHL